VTAGLALSLVITALMGLLTIGCVWPGPTGLWRSRLLAGVLAVGIGLGLSASVFFVWLSLSGAPGPMYPRLELAVVVLLAGVALYAGMMRRSRTAGPTPRAPAAATPLHPLLGLTLWLCLGCATIVFLVRAATSPQGEWDAWMTWNMHARALFRGADHWREVLTALPGWSHPDYPLLVPGSVARIWTYAGRETTLAATSVAMLFTFATVGLLYSAVSVLRSPSQGALAALLLLANKFFIVQGASQYADIPLGFFVLATLVLLSLPEVWPDDRSRLLLLAGATAGFAAWTKNEGLMLLLAVPVAYGLVVGRSRGWRTGLSDARAFGIGLAPLLVMILYFKVWLAPANDLMSDHGLRQTADRLLDGGRYPQVLAGFEHAFLEVSARGLVALLLVGYALFAGPAPAGPARAGARIAVIVVSLMLAGYAAVLLTAPAPLLGTNLRSVNRLLLQLWPSMLFAYFLSVRTAEEAGVVGIPTPPLVGNAATLRSAVPPFPGSS